MKSESRMINIAKGVGHTNAIQSFSTEAECSLHYQLAVTVFKHYHGLQAQIWLDACEKVASDLGLVSGSPPPPLYIDNHYVDVHQRRENENYS